MELSSFPFQTVDWSEIPEEEHAGETGMAYWKIKKMNGFRIRRVRYSPGYKADHWCNKGHILHCTEGEMDTLLKDGREFKLKAGMTYLVGDNNESHQSSTSTGCELFIVD